MRPAAIFNAPTLALYVVKMAAMYTAGSEEFQNSVGSGGTRQYPGQNQESAFKTDSIRYNGDGSAIW